MVLPVLLLMLWTAVKSHTAAFAAQLGSLPTHLTKTDIFGFALEHLVASGGVHLIITVRWQALKAGYPAN